MGSGGGMVEQVSGDCDDEDGCGSSGSGEVKRTLKITDCKFMILTPFLKDCFWNIIMENYCYEYKEIMMWIQKKARGIGNEN